MSRDREKHPTGVPTKAYEDALTGEVTIRAKVDHSGLTVGGKSRALAAADQLLGGLIGIPGGWIEGIRRRNELRREARQRFLEADIAAAMQQVEGLSELGKATTQRVLRDEYRKQSNRAGVWVATEEYLGLPGSDQASADSGDSPNTSNDDADLNPDWLNRFTRFAEDVSNEELQKVWGRVLAGEIRKPNSFSISSLRLLSELDADMALAFQDIYRLSISDRIVRPKEMSGKTLDVYQELQTAGLIRADNFVTITMPPDTNGFGVFLGSKFGLRVIIENPAVPPTIPIILLSRAGMQIGSILERDEIAATRLFATMVQGGGEIELIAVESRVGDIVNYKVLGPLART